MQKIQVNCVKRLAQKMNKILKYFMYAFTILKGQTNIKTRNVWKLTGSSGAKVKRLAYIQ